MNTEDTQKFIKIIDDRINAGNNSAKTLRQYVGIVQSSEGTKVKVRIAGDDTIFTFNNYSGQTLGAGDGVYIKTIGTDLNTGVITEKFQSSLVNGVIEEGQEGQWSYRKWSNGKVDLWCRYTTYDTISGVLDTTTNFTVFNYSVGLPSFVKSVEFSNSSCGFANWWGISTIARIDTNAEDNLILNLRTLCPDPDDKLLRVELFVIGDWK